MTLNLEITNADENLLKALKGVIRLYPDSKLKVKKQELSENGYTKEFERQILKELKEAKSDYAKGKIKAYSVDEFRKAIANGEI